MANKPVKNYKQSVILPDETKEEYYEEDTGNEMLVLEELKNINESTKIDDAKDREK